MERPRLAAFPGVAPCSLSTPMVRGSDGCTASPLRTSLRGSIATELIRLALCFYLDGRFMERLLRGATQAWEPFSLSTRMALVLRYCIRSPELTEVARMPV